MTLKRMKRLSLEAAQRQKFVGRKLLAAFAADRGVAVQEITGRSGRADMIALRLDFMRLCRACRMSSITIGKLLGRDHSTVLYHLNQRRERKYQQELRRKAAKRGKANGRSGRKGHGGDQAAAGG